MKKHLVSNLKLDFTLEIYVVNLLVVVARFHFGLSGSTTNRTLPATIPVNRKSILPLSQSQRTAHYDTG